jgi:hypothetical protein
VIRPSTLLVASALLNSTTLPSGSAMTVVEQHGSVMEGDRLPDPLAGP